MSTPDKSHRQLLEEAKAWLDVAWESGISARDDMNLPTPNADHIFGLSQRIAAALQAAPSAREAIIEECAKVCDAAASVYSNFRESAAAAGCASSVRGLKSASTDGGTATCPRCKGSGDVQAMTNHLGPDDYEVNVECPECKGVGTVDREAAK